MRTRLVLATTLCAALASSPAAAAVIFKQTFDGGLGANEQVSGRFGVGGGKLGHIEGYRNNEYSYYQVAVDLTKVAKAMLTFDFKLQSEPEFDGFNVLGSTGSVFNAKTDLLIPAGDGVYGPMKGRFVRLGDIGAS